MLVKRRKEQFTSKNRLRQNSEVKSGKESALAKENRWLDDYHEDAMSTFWLQSTGFSRIQLSLSIITSATVK